MIPILLPAQLREQIERDASVAYPNECCGILFGHDDGKAVRVVRRLQPVENDFEEHERFHRFSISPQQLMSAERDAADAGEMVLGFYHSHPDHPAQPSEFDRQHAWPFYSYVIVSVVRRTARELTSWVLNEESSQFEEQRIALEGEHP